MNSHRHVRIPSALGAILAATLMTIASAAPDMVHAGEPARAKCADYAQSEFAPAPRPVLL